MADLFNFLNEEPGDERDASGNLIIRGTIDRIVYSDEENGYAVLRVTSSSKEKITLAGKGAIADLYEGVEIEATGKWAVHKEFGKQFKTDQFILTLPVTEKGIKRFLSSGRFKGIGPQMAGKIVRKFGKDTLSIIENYSVRLLEVQGFGKKALKVIQTSWQDESEKRNLYLYLESLGISQAFQRRILNVYEDNAPDIIQENPYRLANDVKGIGFIYADTIARNMGVEKTNPNRITEGVKYTLKNFTDKGNVCYPVRPLLEKAAETLDVAEDLCEEGLNIAIGYNDIHVEPSLNRRDTMLAYPEQFFKIEVLLCQCILSMLAGTKTLQKLGKKLTFINENLNEEQQDAVRNAMMLPFSIMTGGPGVGKTTTVGEIVEQAKKAKEKVYLAAPTGRAAKRMSESTNMGASTIHRLLKWDPIEKGFAYNQDKQLPCKLLIVDEVSMLDMMMAYYLLRAVKPGTRVVFVGDKDQLPSVSSGSVLHDMIASNKIPITKLEKIYRQSEGSRIISNAHRINQGQIPDISKPPTDELSDFYFIQQDDPEKVEELMIQMLTERIPQRFNIQPKDIQVLTPMNKGNCGTESMNKCLQAALNDIHKPQFKYGDKAFIIGDRVMQTSNNYEKLVFNGDMGYIQDVNIPEKNFVIAYDSGLVEYNFDEADQITLAYTVTIHKSQGSEFPAVIVPLLSQHYVMLQRNLIYTAVTRASKLLILIGSRKALEICVQNNRQNTRWTQLAERLKVQ